LSFEVYVIGHPSSLRNACRHGTGKSAGRRTRQVLRTPIKGELRSNSDHMLIDHVYISHGGLPFAGEVVGRFYLTNWNYASDVTHCRNPGVKYAVARCRVTIRRRSSGSENSP
jgi:hypothetical protein